MSTSSFAVDTNLSALSTQLFASVLSFGKCIALTSARV